MTPDSLPLVSVITPTYGRPHYHERLYQSFCHQNYPNKQLLVLDDSPEASSFFTALKDDRVGYHWTPERHTIGDKRNRLLAMADGEIIAHFDDDDFYAPQYLSVMIEVLGKDYALVKLSNWFAFAEEHQSFFYWDTAHRRPFHIVVESGGPLTSMNGATEFPSSFVEDNLWGYGFSYVYRKALYPTLSFNPQDNWGEDLQFLHKVGQAGYACQAIADTQGLVMHIVHSSNTSRMFPQYHLPLFVIKALFPESLKQHLQPHA